MALETLTQKHPILSSAPLVAQICEPFFKKYNLNYFQYLKINRDGSFNLLCNHANWIEFSWQYVNNNDIQYIYSTVKKEVLDPSNYLFLWDNNLPSFLTTLARDHSDINTGMSFVERHEDCYYLIGFAAPTSHKGACDFYLNHIGLLKNFITYFREEKAHLIKEVEKHSVPLPKHRQDPNKDLILLNSDSGRIPVFFKGKEHYITLKEYQCLTKLAWGKSAKQIAQDLQISHRTVETYLQRIKMRTGCHSKQDLIGLVNK